MVLPLYGGPASLLGSGTPTSTYLVSCQICDLSLQGVETSTVKGADIWSKTGLACHFYQATESRFPHLWTGKVVPSPCCNRKEGI